MTNDRFEEFLRSAVHDLDPVPEVPVEEMWARIDQARRFRRPVPGRPVRPVRPAWRRFGGWAAAAAAMLVVGFGIGRFSGASHPNAPPPVAASETQAAPTTVAQNNSDLAANESVQTSADAQSRPVTDRADRGLETPATTDDAGNGPYRLAALSHLSRAEGLLTSVAVGEVDEQLRRWATEMLTTTRLMLDSPAADDPRMARLLEDLELILVQVAATTEDRKDAELQWIQQGLETNDVLPRLRAALPATAP